MEYSNLYAQEVERRRENVFSVCSAELQKGLFYSELGERKTATQAIKEGVKRGQKIR